MEANPLARWLWSGLGFWALVVGKVLVVVAFIWCWHSYRSLPHPYQTALRRCLIAVVVGGTALVCAWNLWQVGRALWYG